VTNDEKWSDDFERVFRELLPRARTVAHRILSDEHDADDAAAEAFARAHASWRRVGRLAYRDAWILRVTSNVAIDMVRKRRPLSFEARSVDHEDASVLRLAVVDALASLPRRQREVVTLRFLDGYSEADTAQVLRVATGTVKKASHRALAALRERLGDELDFAMDAPSEGAQRAAL